MPSSADEAMFGQSCHRAKIISKSSEPRTGAFQVFITTFHCKFSLQLFFASFYCKLSLQVIITSYHCKLSLQVNIASYHYKFSLQSFPNTESGRNIFPNNESASPSMKSPYVHYVCVKIALVCKKKCISLARSSWNNNAHLKSRPDRAASALMMHKLIWFVSALTH